MSDFAQCTIGGVKCRAYLKMERDYITVHDKETGAWEEKVGMKSASGQAVSHRGIPSGLQEYEGPLYDPERGETVQIRGQVYVWQEITSGPEYELDLNGKPEVVTELKGGPYDGRKITTEAKYADQPQQRKFPLVNDQGPPWVVYDGSSAYEMTYIGIEEK